MTTDDDDDFDDEISTANVDVSSPELLDDHRVVPRGKYITSTIKITIVFIVDMHLQKHGRVPAFWCKHGRVRICC